MSYEMSSLKVDRSAKTLRELTLQKMRTAILSSHFLPGERLVERALCEELGVSRTVVREVLRHLETEGLVDMIAHQGPSVATIDVGKAAQIYEIRALLEGHAAFACAQQANAEVLIRLRGCIEVIQQAFADRDYELVLEQTTVFYEELFMGSGNNVAWEIVRSLNARINRLRSMTISSEDRGREAVGEMNCIMDAIAANDPPRARDAAVTHVRRVAEIAAMKLAKAVNGSQD